MKSIIFDPESWGRKIDDCFVDLPNLGDALPEPVPDSDIKFGVPITEEQARKFLRDLILEQFVSAIKGTILCSKDDSFYFSVELKAEELL